VKGLGPISDELLLIQKHQIKESSSRFSLFGILFIVFSALAPTFFLVYFALGGSLLSQSIPESLFVAGMLVLFPALSILVLMVAKSSSGPKESAPAFVLNPIRFFQEQSRKEEMEKLLPDALIALAATPAGSSTESTFASLAKGGYGPLSEEFKISFKQLRSKISLEKVLVDMAKRNPSILVKRACYLLNYIFSTNHLASAARLAEDLLIQLELKRERAAALAIHKYTLFFGAILVPTILSLSISICGQLSQFTGGSNTVLIYPVIYVYLFVYAAMVSYFAADSEGKPSLLVVYFPLLFAVSLITFNTVKLF
jgi:hypothetical protein